MKKTRRIYFVCVRERTWNDSDSIVTVESKSGTLFYARKAMDSQRK